MNKTTLTPATAENDKCLRIRIFTNFLLRLLRQAKFLTSTTFLTNYCFSVILLLRVKE